MTHAHPWSHSKCPPCSSPHQTVPSLDHCLHSESTGAPGFGPVASGRWAFRDVRGTMSSEESRMHEKRVDESQLRYLESLDLGFGTTDGTSGTCSPRSLQVDSKSNGPVASIGPTSKADRSRFSPRSLKSKVKLQAYLLDHGFPGAHRHKWIMTCSGPKKTYPIHAAAKAGDEVFVRLLLEEGVNIKQKDSRKRTAYDIAHNHNHNHSHAGVLRRLAGRSDLVHGDTEYDLGF